MGCSFLTPACNITSWSSRPSSWRCDYMSSVSSGQLSTKYLVKDWEPALSPLSQTGKKRSWFGFSGSQSSFCESSKQLWAMSFSLPSSPQPSLELAWRKSGSCSPTPSPNLTRFITILSSSGQAQSSWEGQVYEKHGVSGIYTLSQQARSLGILFH